MNQLGYTWIAEDIVSRPFFSFFEIMEVHGLVKYTAITEKLLSYM
jgi:hypothetical protein